MTLTRVIRNIVVLAVVGCDWSRIKMEGRSSTSSPSPYQSLGDRPEMELDLWEGQFNLSSLKFLDGDEPDSLDLSSFTQEELETYRMGSTCWGKDSSVTMGTVRYFKVFPRCD